MDVDTPDDIYWASAILRILLYFKTFLFSCFNQSFQIHVLSSQILYIASPPVSALSRSRAPFIPCFDTRVEGVSTVTYFRSCSILLSGIDSIASLTSLVMVSVGTTKTSLSIRFSIALAIPSFIEEFENSVRHMNPSRMSGNDSEPGLKTHVI